MRANGGASRVAGSHSNRPRGASTVLGRKRREGGTDSSVDGPIGERQSLASRDGGDDRATTEEGNASKGVRQRGGNQRRRLARSRRWRPKPGEPQGRLQGATDLQRAERSERIGRGGNRRGREERRGRTRSVWQTRASRELRLERMRTRRRAGRRRGAMVPEENERTGECRRRRSKSRPP